MLLEKNQALCERLGRAIYEGWMDLFWEGAASDESFPEPLDRKLGLDMRKSGARLRYLEERFADPELAGRTRNPWRRATRELMASHRASCRMVMEPPKRFNDFSPSYAWEGYKRARRKHRTVVEVPPDAKRRLEDRVNRRLAEIDEALEEELQRVAETRAREERERRRREREEYERFLREKREQEERRATWLRSVREERQAQNGDGGR